jgi:hypothetical protein
MFLKTMQQREVPLELGEDEAICRNDHCLDLTTGCLIVAVPDAKTNHRIFCGLREHATPDAFLY